MTRSLMSVFATLTVLSTQAFASHLVAYPDTVRFTSGVGVLSTYNVFVTDGRDSSQFPHTPLTLANVWITGSNEFNLGSDTIIDFFGNTYVVVQFDASNTSPSSAVLHIEGDSNAITVVLIGNPPNHQNLSFTGQQDLGVLTPGVTKCDSVILYNPNAFSVSIMSLTIAGQHANCQITDFTTAFVLGAGRSITFYPCVTAEPDSGRDTLSAGGTIVADYTYANGGSDSADYTISGYVLPLDSTCLSIGYPIDFGGCYDGATSSQPIATANTTSADVTVDSIIIVNGDTAEFQIPQTQFPITLPGGSTSGSFNASFSPPNTATHGEQFSAGIVIYSTGKSKGGFPCIELAGTLVGEAQVLLADTIVLNAPPGGASTINISTNRTMSRHAIYINNDTTVSINPISLQLTDSNQDAYFGSAGNELANIYDSLIAPNANPYLFNPIIMTLDAPDTGTYNVDMTLTFQILRADRKTEITSEPVYNYHIVAHRLPSAASSVSQSAPPVAEFSINPNPAHGEVTISLPTDVSSMIEIYDILGNLIISTKANGSFVWNGATSAGVMIPNGAYIVRVRETRTNGQIVTASKRLMYLH